MKPQLLFRSQRTLYSVDADSVLEVVGLPALSSWPGAPTGVVGVINYRGEILPVLDVARRLGGESVEPKATDELVIVETALGRGALLVEEALELNSELLLFPVADPPPASLARSTPFLAGLGSHKEQVVLGVEAARLLDFPLDSVPEEAPSTAVASELMRQRAIDLATPLIIERTDEGRALVIVSLCEELLGVPVEEVAELTHCPPLTPVPGAPPHLLGLAYHRGGLLRLVDIRERCGLDTLGPLPISVVILRGPGMLTGILVDSIEEVAKLPGLGSKLDYQGRWVTVLDTESLAVREPRLEQETA